MTHKNLILKDKANRTTTKLFWASTVPLMCLMSTRQSYVSRFFFYAPTIRRVVERANCITSVRPSVRLVLSYELYLLFHMPIKTLCVICNKLTRSHWSCPSTEIAKCVQEVKTLPCIGITNINNVMILVPELNYSSRMESGRRTRMSIKIQPTLVISKSKGLSKILRHIRFAELRKNQIEQQHLTNVYVFGLLKLEVFLKYCGNGEKLLPISPLFYNILLPFISFSCLGRDQIFTSR